MDRISTLSALYTSAALTAALTQKWIQIFFGGLGLYNVYVFWEDYTRLPNVGRHDALQFRFTPTELRGGGTSQVRACVCVCERERERERESMYAGMYACMYIYIHFEKCMCMCVHT
jgi:hypothetical protein